MSGRRILLLLLVASAPTRGHASILGQAVGQATASALGRAITIGPLLGGAVGLGGERVTGDLLGGLAVSVVAPEAPLVGVTLFGGYRFGEEVGLVGMSVGAGWWRVSLGIGLLGAVTTEGGGFALGPELTFHQRVPLKRARHEVQLFVRGDLGVAGGLPSQGTLGLRLVYDLFP